MIECCRQQERSLPHPLGILPAFGTLSCPAPDPQLHEEEPRSPYCPAACKTTHVLFVSSTSEVAIVHEAAVEYPNTWVRQPKISVSICSPPDSCINHCGAAIIVQHYCA